MLKVCVGAMFLSAVGGVASAAMLSQYTFSDTGMFSSSSQVSGAASHVNASPVVMHGLSTTMVSSPGLWSTEMLGEMDYSAYYEWSIEPATNYKLNLNYVDIAFYPDSSSSCDEYTLYVNGMSYGSASNSDGWVTTTRFPLGLGPTTQKVTFQVYPYGDNSFGGVFGLTGDLVVDGTVSAVPEPAFLGVGALLVPLLARRRRA